MIRSVPALDKSLALRGSLSIQDFKGYVEKSVEKNAKFTTYILGYLRIDPQGELALKKVFDSSHAAYFVKYNPFCKLLLFPRSLLDKSWVTQIGIDIKDILGATNYQFRFIILFNRSVLASGKYPTPAFFDPVPIHESAANLESAIPSKEASSSNLFLKNISQIYPLENQTKQINRVNYARVAA